MNRYANIDCPVCNRPLDDGSDIVVCPECGAPYHLDCYKRNNHCIYTELHERNEDWEPPHKEQKYDGKASLRCSRCGTVNPEYALFCQVCGNQLSNKNIEIEQENSFSEPNLYKNPNNDFPNNSMPLNPFISPFAGVSPEEEIDGVKAKELAIFVGNNSHYFLPKFKLLSQTKNKVKTINWGAFFFTGGYFLYRKMYALGIITILFEMLLQIPNAIIAINAILTASALDTPVFNMSKIEAVAKVTQFLIWVIRFLCGFFANSLYKKSVFKKIAVIKEKNMQSGEESYLSELRKKGSVAIKLVTGLVIIYFALIAILFSFSFFNII